MKSLFVIPLAILVAGASASAASATDTYRAHGTEPFWSIEIADGQVRVSSPDRPEFSEPIGPSRLQNDRTSRYDSARVTLVVIAGAACNNGMSEQVYPDTTVAVVDGEVYANGCGGEPLAPETLADTNWAIVEIGGEAVSGERYRLQFTADRISGQAGCNRLSGGYRQAGGTLTPGPLAMTRMACPGPFMAHERRAAEILGGPVQVSFPDGDTLVLTGANGAIRLRRII